MATDAAPEDHRMHPCWSISSRHLFSTRQRLCPAPALCFTNTAHYTSQLQMTDQSIYYKPRAGFPSFLLSCPQPSERVSPPPASSPERIMCYSKLLLQDAAGKLDTPVSSRYNEPSIRNTALATNTELCRVPGQSTIFKKFYPYCPAQTSQITLVTPAQVSSSEASFSPNSSCSPVPAPASGAAAAAAAVGDAPRAAVPAVRTAVKFPRDRSWSPSPPCRAHGSHTHLSWPAWSWGSACSRLGAARSLSARPRPPPRASPPPPLAAPALARGRRFTRGSINPNALFIRPRINSRPK